MLQDIASCEALETAFTWLCQRCKDYPEHADVWALRFHWLEQKARIQDELLSGHYCFEPQSVIRNRDGEVLNVWSARNALVLKSLATVLSGRLPVSKRCVHVKGHGGVKAAVRAVWAQLPHHRFVLKTDVQSYYDSIDHFLLLEKLAVHVKDRKVLNLLWQYMRRVSERGGIFTEHDTGISRGCALSPLIGAFFLDDLDREMEKSGLFYVRYSNPTNQSFFLILITTRVTHAHSNRLRSFTLNSIIHPPVRGFTVISFLHLFVQ